MEISVVPHFYRNFLISLKVINSIMKHRLVITFSLMIIASLGIAQALEKQAVRDVPEIVMDTSPLDRSNDVRVTSFADVLDDVTPAVVSVYTTKILRGQNYSLPPMFRNDPFLRRFFGVPESQENQPRAEGLGSGVIVTHDGYILTNNHVIDGADEVNVRLSDGRQFEAEIIGADPKTDIAVLKVEAAGLPALALADSEQSRVGDIVFAVGNPLGVGQTVTQGIISATNRSSLSIIEEGGYENFIQTDAAINQGNSGGPLVDAEGRIVGINTAILSQSGGSIGIGFAIPSSLARSIMMSLIENGEVTRGYLGVAIGVLDQDLAEEFGMERPHGALVTQVHENTPAEKAGLKPGDIVTQMDGHDIMSSADFRVRISLNPPGTEIALKILRDGDFLDIPVTLASLTDAAGDEFGVEPLEIIPGVTLMELTDSLRQQFRIGREVEGLVIADLDRDSPFIESFRPGMVIVAINRQPVTSMEEARNAMRPNKNLLYIYYQGRYNYSVIRLE